jgi:hypothetical protein
MWWPDEEAPGAWWCEDCSRFWLKRNVKGEYYVFPREIRGGVS